MFYVQLWFDKNGCQGHLWYLAIDFWYYLSFPIIANIYYRSKSSGIITLIIMILGSMIQNGYNSWYTDAALVTCYNEYLLYIITSQVQHVF